MVIFWVTNVDAHNIYTHVHIHTQFMVAAITIRLVVMAFGNPTTCNLICLRSIQMNYKVTPLCFMIAFV